MSTPPTAVDDRAPGQGSDPRAIIRAFRRSTRGKVWCQLPNGRAGRMGHGDPESDRAPFVNRATLVGYLLDEDAILIWARRETGRIDHREFWFYTEKEGVIKVTEDLQDTGRQVSTSQVRVITGEDAEILIQLGVVTIEKERAMEVFLFERSDARVVNTIRDRGFPSDPPSLFPVVLQEWIEKGIRLQDILPEGIGIRTLRLEN